MGSGELQVWSLPPSSVRFRMAALLTAALLTTALPINLHPPRRKALRQLPNFAFLLISVESLWRTAKCVGNLWKTRPILYKPRKHAKNFLLMLQKQGNEIVQNKRGEFMAGKKKGPKKGASDAPIIANCSGQRASVSAVCNLRFSSPSNRA